jgi:hypothetical protein
MALILASHLSPLPVLEGYDDSMLGVLPEYRSAKSLVDKIIDEDVIKVERSSNNIVLTFNYSILKSKTYTISSSIFQPNKRLQLFVQKSGDFCVLDLNTLLRNHNFYRIRTLKNLLSNTGPLVEIYFHNSFSEGIVLINRQPVSNETFELKNRYANFTDYVITKFPSVQSIKDADKNKTKVLLNLDYIDSIVALEQQVDLLTTLVSNLINNQSQPSWSSDFLNKVATSNVTTVRSVSDVIEDLDSLKKKIRATQKTYFDNK